MKGLVGGGVGGWHSPDHATVTRYTTTLDPAGGMYYSVPRTVIPAGVDFEWEFELSPFSTTFYLLGDSTSANTNNRLGLSGAKWFGFNFNIVEGANRTWFNDGKLHNVNVSRVAGVITIKVDGIYDISNVYTGELSFDGFGRKFGGVTSTATYSGVIFKSKLTVPSNTALNHDYRFDDNDGVLVDYSKSLIPIDALTPFNNATSGTATWVSNPNGSTTMTTNGSQSYAYNGWSFPAIGGYRYFFDISSDKAARLVVYAFTQGLTDYVNVASNIESSLSSSGITSAVPAGKNRLLVVHQVNETFGADTLTTQVPLVKKADGYGQSVNVTAADRELMTFDSGHNAWVGGELWIENSVVTTGGNPWVINGGGSYTRNSGAAFGQLYLNNPPIIGGANYIVSFNVTQVTGSLRVITRNASGINVRGSASAAGFFEFKVTAEDNFNGYIWFDTDSPGSSATINTVSLKRIIEVAQ